MKKILNIVLIITILFLGANVSALNIGQTEEISFPSNYKYLATGSSDYIIFYDHRNVYRYEPETNKLEKIYTISYDQFAQVYARGDYVYVWYKQENTTDKGIVDKIFVKTGSKISSTTINQGIVYGGNFVVDLKGNYYFEDNKTITVYNVSGEVVKEVETSIDLSSLLDFTPNDEYLIAGYSYGSGEAILKLENGGLESGEMFKYKYRQPEWKFASDGVTAVNQYGELVQFNYNNLTKPYTLKVEALSSSKNNGINFYETTDKYYIPNSTGYLVGISKTDYKPKDKVFVKSNVNIVHMKYANNSLYVICTDNMNSYSSKYYVVRVDLSNKIESRNIVLNTHTTLSHTKSAITNKYIAAKPTADYTNRYKTEPSKTSPYYEGSLKDEVVQDTLNQINYYRYLAGLNSVTLNTNKQPRSQKCALVQAVNDTLSHYPQKPDDMDQTFYEEAKAGCGASYEEGDTYSGNVSYNTRIDKAPAGFIDDNYNVSPNTGHRNSLLDPFAKQVSFGNVTPYVGLSMYYDNTNNNSDLFYAWPSAGYFPAESILQQEKTMWSIWLDKSIKVQSNTTIKLTYNNKTYTIPGSWINYDNIDNVLAYYFPANIRDEIVSNTNRFINGEKVHVNISNLSDRDINTYEIDYDVNFFNAEIIPLESIDVFFSKEESSYGSVVSPNKTIKLNKDTIYEIGTSIKPSNATVGRFSYKLSDTSKATLEGNKITPKKGGTITLTLTDSYTKKSFDYIIKVYEMPTNMYFKNNKITIKKGEKYTIPQPIIEPSTATIESGVYVSANTSIAYVSNGQIIGIKAGTTTITYKDNYHTDAPTATIEVTVYEDQIDIKDFSFYNNSIALETGKTTTISTIITPSNATNKTITWTSSNPSIATVDSTGKVTGLKEGQTTITGTTSNGKTATCIVVVSNKVVAVTGLNVNKYNVSLIEGNSETITATITPSNATIKKPVWTSKDPSIATVDSNGKITGIKAGSVIVIASAGSISSIINVTVTSNVEVTNISLNKNSLSLIEGISETLIATISPSNATNKNITWTSSNTAVATVTNGKVTALKEGTATITAKTNNGKTATCQLTVRKIPEDQLIPVYRMYNPINGEHLYTTDAYEVSVIYKTQGWGKEGIGWYTTSEGTPVYRLYNPKLGNHLYTSDKNEINIITRTQGWVLDFNGEPVMYASGTIPIYRLFNPGLQGQHHLTTDKNEYNVIPQWGWKQEGEAMKAQKIGVPQKTEYYKK